mgnify:CR=1 FL=1
MNGRFFLHQVLHCDDSPHRLALGAALGTLVAFTPTIGFQMAIVVLLGGTLALGAVEAMQASEVLFSVVMGALLLKERMHATTAIAFVMALTAVIFLMISGGIFPWFAILLAVTFSFYGLVKKLVDTDSYTGLFLETMIASPLAAAILVVYGAGSGIMFGQDWATSLLLIGAGPATALPLIMFSAAARRISLTAIGFFQYLSPTLMLVLGVTVFQKPVSPAELVSFIVVWAALIIYSAGAMYRMRKSRAL